MKCEVEYCGVEYLARLGTIGGSVLYISFYDRTDKKMKDLFCELELSHVEYNFGTNSMDIFGLFKTGEGYIGKRVTVKKMIKE